MTVSYERTSLLHYGDNFGRKGFISEALEEVNVTPGTIFVPCLVTSLNRAKEDDYTKADAIADANADANSDANANANDDANANATVNADANANANVDTNDYANADAIRDANANATVKAVLNADSNINVSPQRKCRLKCQ